MRYLVYFAVLFGLAWGAHADTLTGQVVGISDGDTLTLLVDGAKLELQVRLAGIDAPEKGMDFGNRAKQSLSDMAFGKAVVVEYGKRDKYGRFVGKVLVDGQDVNLAQLVKGMAWHYKAYAHEQIESDRAVYAAAEHQARSERIGLWRDSMPIPPWDWRHGTAPRVSTVSGGESPAMYDGQIIHVGPRGGRYIITPGGNKRYLSQDE